MNGKKAKKLRAKAKLVCAYAELLVASGTADEKTKAVAEAGWRKVYKYNKRYGV